MSTAVLLRKQDWQVDPNTPSKLLLLSGSGVVDVQSDTYPYENETGPPRALYGT
jgi:hypothetical protein